MRCTVCNNLLTDEESVRKYPATHPLFNNYIDTCTECLEQIREIERDYEESKKKRGNVTHLKHT